MVLKTMADIRASAVQFAGEMSRLSDFRAGSISALVSDTVSLFARCAKPNDAGHVPDVRLTYKGDGKTCSKSLDTPLKRDKAEREIEEIGNFQLLCREVIDVNTEICRLRCPTVAGPFRIWTRSREHLP